MIYIKKKKKTYEQFGNDWPHSPVFVVSKMKYKKQKNIMELLVIAL